ncbi:MAG: EVE domain-containing protein, partial [Alphaproteobacteria bacterium]
KADTPRWLLVDVQALRKTRLLALPELRAAPELADLILLRRGNRLSITPVSAAHWRIVDRMLNAAPA